MHGSVGEIKAEETIPNLDCHEQQKRWGWGRGSEGSTGSPELQPNMGQQILHFQKMVMTDMPSKEEPEFKEQIN
jgi:hypothetical protein